MVDEKPSEPLRLRAAVRRFVRSFGLLASDRTPCGTPIQLSTAHALVHLLDAARRDETTTQQDLAAVLHIDKSNVTRLCAKLERDGFVHQRPAEHDRRARWVSLTSKGHALAERVDARSLTRFARLLSAIPADTHAVVLDALDALASAATTLEQESP